MSLRHAILGILDYREMHGYQLKRVLDEGISNFWPVNLAAIYPSLRKLEEEGLVAHHTEESGEGRPARKVYTITDDGREELVRWRKLSPDGGTRVRNPLFLKLLFAHEEDFPDAVGWIDKQLEQLRSARDRFADELANPRAFSTLVVQFMRESGVAHLELELELLEELRARLVERTELRSRKEV